MMMQKDKELLLKDLSARLPYKVKVNIKHKEYGSLIGVLYAVYPDENRIIVDELDKAIAPQNVRCGGFLLDECEIKPFLRPISSMTDEEKEEFNKIKETVEACFINAINKDGFTLAYYKLMDWLNKNFFDYRGLIEKGLVLKAPEGMYG